MKTIPSCLSCALLLAAISHAQPQPAPVVEMEPYVVRDTRILPPPEQWHYVKVPALVLRRGNRDIVAPGYELISNLNPGQTRVFVEELQLRQFASTFIWPMLTQALPKAPVYVVVDINQQYSGMLGKIPKPNELWDGDTITPSHATSAPGIESNRNFAVWSMRAFEDEYGLSRVEASLDEQAEAVEDEEETGTLITSTSLMQQILAAMAAEEDLIKPLPDGFVRLAMNGGQLAALVKAGAPFADTERPGEERFAATLSYQLNLFALYSLERKPPPWFARGLGNLLGSTQVSRAQIQFALIREKLIGRDMPRLIIIFQKKEDDRFTLEETMLASVFVHYALYGENGRYAQPFMAFVDRLARGEEPTPELFREVFRMRIGGMEAALAGYARNFGNFKSMEISGKIPPMPAPVYRDATQSESARIKAEMHISQARPALALNELRIACWRGEREPAMLALLASLELQIGTESRARKITKTLMTLPKPPPQACVALARLQLKDTLAAKPAGDAKLTAQETTVLIETLGGALAGGLTTEDLCSALAEVILHSATAPDPNIAAFLSQAAKRYPQNQTIAAACKPATQ